jgi:hypothetical protein
MTLRDIYSRVLEGEAEEMHPTPAAPTSERSRLLQARTFLDSTAYARAEPCISTTSKASASHKNATSGSL